MDLILAIIVFIMLLVSVLIFWEHAQSRHDQVIAKHDIGIVSRLAAQTLLQSPGNPASWEYFPGFNASQLGIVDSPFSLNINKVEKLVLWNSTDYVNIKNSLGLQGYDFLIEIYNYSTSSKQFQNAPSYLVGKNVSVNATEVVRIERTLKHISDWKKFVLQVWK